MTGRALITIVVVLLCSVFAGAQSPADTVAVDTAVVKQYIPKATFDDFRQLKQESTLLGIGNNFACQNYYGIFYMCELPPYNVGKQTYSGRWSNVQYKLSGTDSTHANLILITAELHNPDYAAVTTDLFIDVVRKTLNALGETLPDGLKTAVVNMSDFKIRTNRGYTIRLKAYHTQFDALELKIDATGME